MSRQSSTGSNALSSSPSPVRGRTCASQDFKGAEPLHIRLSRPSPAALVVADLGYGDSGKGAVADLLCHTIGIRRLYRHGGGPNSVHHVAAAGVEVAVSAFGSFLAPGVRTNLGPAFAVKPRNILLEARSIERVIGYSPLPGLSVDPAARIVLPWHAIVGQLRELIAGPRRRGSTGQGVGEAILTLGAAPTCP